MASYTITAINWNSASFWSSISETTAGHTLDFSQLGPSYSLTVEQDTGTLTLSDGTQSFSVGQTSTTGTDASFGTRSLLAYFTTIYGVDGTNLIDGTNANDTIVAFSQDDTLTGGEGDDAVFGGSGNDQIDGQAGADTLYADVGDDFVSGGAGADVIFGDAGDDQLEGGWQDSAADTIIGGDGNDLVFGYGGDDFITGDSGYDWLDGGAGNDYIDGGLEEDRIVGDLGNDTLLGGDANDTLSGGEGADSVDGGGGADHIFGAAGDIIYGGETGNDSDTLYVSNVDFITYTTAESGTVTFNSGEILQFSGIEQIVELTKNGVVEGTSGDDELGQFDFDADGDWIDNGDAIGESDADSVRSGAGNDTIWANDGDDTVHGEAGDDQIYVGQGDNIAFGGSGADTLSGDWGNDTLSGDDFVTTGPNLIINGSFEDTTGMTPTVYGFDAPSGNIVGWTDANGFSINVHNDNRGGLNATDGSNWMDMESASGQHNVISQSVEGISDGQAYLLSFDVGDITTAADGMLGDNQLQLLWNGELVGTIDASDGSFTNYTFHLIGGAGDGSNTLSFAGFGANDALGLALDNVQLYAAVEASGGASDSITAGWGDDDVLGGAGQDTLEGGGGNDHILGGTGNDSIAGEDGNDTLYGGAGNDVITGGGGDDLLVSDTAPFDPLDHPSGSSGAATSLTVINSSDAPVGLWWIDQSGALVPYSTIAAGGSRVQPTFETHNWVLLDADGQALEYIPAGLNQTITYTEPTLSNTLDGEAGNDTLVGGVGSDSLTGGIGDDSLSGGAGDDTFLFADGFGADTITDFSITDDNRDGVTNDQLDVSALYDQDSNPVNVWDVTVTDTNGDGSGDAVLLFPNGESITLAGIRPDQVNSAPELQSIGIPCYASGTLIQTSKGQQPVQSLRCGDKVLTSEGQYAPILWQDKTVISLETLQSIPRLRPVRIKPDTLGNTAALFVSQQHCFLVSANGAPRFLRAKHLAEQTTLAHIIKPKDTVTYHHILLPKHAVIFANGAASESFYPGPESLKMLSLPSLASLSKAIAPIAGQPLSAAYGSRRFPCLSRKDVTALAPIPADLARYAQKSLFQSV